jgi:hypothetical protein
MLAPVSTPPFIVIEDRLYGRSVDMSPEAIRGVVAANNGSVDAAAAQLQLPVPVVQAAVDLADAPPTIETSADTTGSLSNLKDLFGLFAGVGVVVYVLGGAILIARLYYAHLPYQAVFGQLPREFLITVGISQALVYGLIAAALYALLRGSGAIGGSGANPLVVTLLTLLAWAALMGVVLWLSGLREGGVPGLEDATEFWLVVAVVLLVVVAAAAVVRGQYAQGNVHWRPGPDWITLAIAYGLVVTVAAASASATFPLLAAKACASAGFQERGDLVGHSGDRIFLGEQVRGNRRIVSLPSGDVEELFVGPHAEGAGCDPRGPAGAITASRQSRIATDKTGDAQAQLRLVRQAKDVQSAAEPAGKLADSALDVARAARLAAEGVDRARPGQNSVSVAADQILDAARDADTAGGELRVAVDRIRGAVEGEPPGVEELQTAASDAAAKAQVAATRAKALADETLDAVTRPTS